MKRLGHDGSSGRPDDIEDAEFVEIDNEPASEPAYWPPPPPPKPTLGAWRRHQGFFIKTLIVFIPLLFLAMCVATVGDAPDAAVETSNFEQEVDQLENAADQTRLMTEAMEPDVEAAGPPTCASIEGEASRMLAKTIGKEVLEINNTRSDTVDNFPRCFGSALTEAGTVFITYGVQISQKDQPYFYVRLTSDTLIPPGMENDPMPRYTAQAEPRQDDAAPPTEPAPPPTATPSPTAPPTPAASPQPTDDDIYAPHP